MGDTNNINNNNKWLKNFPWITKDFCYNLVSGELKDERIKFINYTIQSAIGEDENYISQVLRVTVTYSKISDDDHRSNNNDKHHQITMIIKTDLKENQVLSNELNILTKEVIVYNNILPRIYQLLTTINDNSIMSPRSFGCNADNPFYIALEDLTLTGYKNVKISEGLGVEHFKCVLKKLAKWHGTTAVLMNENQNLFLSHMKSNINDTSNIMYVLFKNALLACGEVVRQWPNFENIGEKMIKTANTTLYEKAFNAYARDDKQFNVLNHGDLWCNNLMFKNAPDDPIHRGAVQDVIFIDYQLGFWGSPAIDITYFFFTTSYLGHVEEKHWDSLIMYYHNQLIETLDKLNYTGMRPSLIDIQCEFIRRGICSAILSIINLVVHNREKSVNLDMSTLTTDSKENDAIKFKLYGNKNCKSDLQSRIDYFHRKGYFD